MPRYMLNGKAMRLNNKPVQYNNALLSFQVKGDKFPMVAEIYSNISTFSFVSSENNVAIIDFGDGSIITYAFINNRLDFRPNIPLGDSIRQPIYTYTDGKTGIRTIRVSFLKPEKIIQFISAFVTLYGVFPNEISNLTNLTQIIIRQSELTSFPPSISYLNSLRYLQLETVGTAISERIPDELMTIPLTTLNIRESINLSNPDASNFRNLCTVSSMKTTLKFLNIELNNATLIPEMANLINLETLLIRESSSPIIPQYIVDNLNLEILNAAGLRTTDYGCVFPVNSKIKVLGLVYSLNFTTTIPASFVNLTLLKEFSLDRSYVTTSRINAFITNFYNFINTNAAKSGVATLAFRGITLAITGIAPTGTFQQPAGYVAGSNNGSPASPKEMLWVLQNQYLHTIIYTA